VRVKVLYRYEQVVQAASGVGVVDKQINILQKVVDETKDSILKQKRSTGFLR